MYGHINKYKNTVHICNSGQPQACSYRLVPSYDGQTINTMMSTACVD
jgi:hypothetical protein